MIIFFSIFGLLVFGFLSFVIKLVLKGKNSAWQGEIIDKIHNTKRDDEKLQHIYSIKVKTTEGKTIDLGVSANQFEDYKIGDKLDKKKGEIWPKKIN